MFRMGSDSQKDIDRDQKMCRWWNVECGRWKGGGKQVRRLEVYNHCSQTHQKTHQLYCWYCCGIKIQKYIKIRIEVEVESKSKKQQKGNRVSQTPFLSIFYLIDSTNYQLILLFFPNYPFISCILIKISKRPMKRKTQKALIIEQYGGKIRVKDIPMPEIKEGEVLIKVQASTINPSDKLLMDGACFERPLPSICGIQGTGRVIDAKGELASLWIGTRVCFISPAYGSWVEYSVSTPFQIFEIEQDTPLQSAACGLVNPLTALGFVERYRALGCKYGMINTAAASALGRMLIRLCKKQKIPLLNIVHRQKQKQMLMSEGADYVIVTKGEWEAEYREFIFKNKYDCLFDALGGGVVTEKLISNLLPGARVLAYGALQGKPLVINSVIQLLKGLTVEGFLIFSWWGRCSPQLQESIRQNLSEYLIGDLSTNLLKQVSMEQIDEGLMLSQKRASEGKVILRICKDV